MYIQRAMYNIQYTVHHTGTSYDVQRRYKFKFTKYNKGTTCNLYYSTYNLILIQLATYNVPVQLIYIVQHTLYIIQFSTNMVPTHTKYKV